MPSMSTAAANPGRTVASGVQPGRYSVVVAAPVKSSSDVTQ